ncbi:hypothetical protein HGG82_11375 [Marinomonas sp. M1K-6]|uniref:Lipoprotein n=1 Tax=Marinomonas profundi TaxID=2726122 RepID=A0A847QYQ0_9GAMM|nr:hypothetical protein [Marinomonas profundi]NLQ18219.1 hypothetical protein [Marinomonas profundi]UDV03572.1 hypothetical protein J8N69_01935 [Marinomonas profundi]
MKLGIVLILSALSAGCGLLGAPPVIQESYFVPVIRSDSSSSGYIPSVTPMSAPRTQKERPRIYTPVLR